MLELHKLLDSVDEMSQEAARQQKRYADLAAEARGRLQNIPADEKLMAKIEQAIAADSSWRGAKPLEGVLDMRRLPQAKLEQASLIGVDGSQIYPDRHGAMLYYLLNIGAIVLRRGSSEAPATETIPTLYFDETNLYDDQHYLVGSEYVNSRRELAEVSKLAALAMVERRYVGGDQDHLVVAMKDGQLMLWLGEKEQKENAKLLQRYIDQLDEIRKTGGVPVGFVGRPRSANVVRLLWVAGLKSEDITQENVRKSGFRALTDKMLFAPLLAPNQRSAIFSNTAKVNRQQFAERGQRVCFFYTNVARQSGADAARIVRVDIPEWAALQPALVDQVQMAIYEDCAGTGFPYVLIRADELAVVSQQEKRDFEHVLAVAIAQTTGSLPEASPKAAQKELSRGYKR
jgi:hypothetical protein